MLRLFCEERHLVSGREVHHDDRDRPPAAVVHALDVLRFPDLGIGVVATYLFDQGPLVGPLRIPVGASRRFYVCSPPSLGVSTVPVGRLLRHLRAESLRRS